MSDFKISKKEIGKSLSQFYKVPFVEYDPDISIPVGLLTNLKVPFMRNNVWVPLKIEDRKIVIAIDNPGDLQKIGEIKTLFSNKPLSFNVALKQDILAFIQCFTRKERKLASRSQILSELKTKEVEIEDEESVLYEEDSAIVQLVNKIIIDAYKQKASDIHIEPYPGKINTQIRIRVDGA
jgi:type II secretory ATPase GspE/PulE/Tfp pilus assembly ATPase PilB-like protein